ncbi:MAG: dTDP-glucose 4,6-dehydratase [Sphingomonadales bacterium 32-68-7]|nr:MAG: dTDP-glucose 4,6-dehydratase [Sphingomonadales bacterium 12-68-11]OYX08760.1 MAG: dTDP-glucose 4,6-dehydratase [Sphingomonadales bacterium 32-68-7]
MAELLITGGAGFIGSNFARYWRHSYPADRVTILDALSYAGNRSNLADLSGIDLIVGDIRDTALVERLLRAREIDTLVHFAAESHVDRSISHPDLFVSTNVVGTHSLLEAARRVWIADGTGQPHRFHHISTDEVFGSLRPHDPPFSERSPYRPSSPYSASKASADHLVQAYHRTYDLQATISICSNNYGPHQFPEKLIPFFVINGLEGRPLPIYGDGLNVRDWLHVEDHCRGIDAAICLGRAGETYNIGGGQKLPNLLVVDAICASIDQAFASAPQMAQRFPKAPAAHGLPSASLRTFVPDRPGHDRHYALDCTKAEAELGYSARRDFADGLVETVHWYLNNADWWLPLRGCAEVSGPVTFPVSPG